MAGAGTTETAVPAAASEEVPELTVTGDLASRATFITATRGALLVGLGELAGPSPAEVLVPYVDLQLEGRLATEEQQPWDDAEEGNGRVLFSAVMPVEVMALLIADLAAEYRHACQQLGRLAGAELQPEPVRLRQAAGVLEAAQADLEAARRALRRLGQGAERHRGRRGEG
jgi:hypothetical protein